MKRVSLVSIPRHAEDIIVYCARASNPESQQNGRDADKLLRYCLRNAHWSPFDMVSITMEVNTSRAIGRQILRHWSFRFQEFSQRYADPTALPDLPTPEARAQHPTNRQMSTEIEDPVVKSKWEEIFVSVREFTKQKYREARELGIAREQARNLLIEHTPTRMYMAGTVRSWIHFCQLRGGNGTQKEATLIANEAAVILHTHLPVVAAAADLYSGKKS